VQHAQAAATQPMLSPQHREQLRAQWSQRSRLPGVRVLRAESAGTHEIGPVLESCSLATLLEQPALLEECFGPGTLLVHCSSETELLRAAVSCPGSLTATVQRAPADEALARTLLATLLPRAGRLIVDGVPTGVEVNSSMQHGGPFPASTRVDSTSVGGRAIQRWLRPVCFQNFPGEWLPEELQDANPLSLRRTVNGKPG
jgi:NADP-dependent aldehyde dehydrogenase